MRGRTYFRLTDRASAIALALALLGADPLLAADPQGTQTAAPAAPASGDNGQGGLAEIVVTAQRRSEPLQNVPITVSAISAAAAQAHGITDSSTIANAVPGLDFSRQGSSGGTPYLRGVGESNATAGAESSVATYVDDVYIAAPSANLFALDNIDRIEVLKGPQGTLFGRNATGGVIHVFTRNPSFKPSADVNLGYANFNTPSFSVYGTTGVTDSVAVNLAVQGSDQRDGWGKALESGKDILKEKDLSVRAKVLWQISSSTKLLLSGDYTRYDSDIGAQFAPIAGSYALTGLPNPGKYNTWSAGNDFDHLRQGGVSARFESDLGPATLVSISAWRKSTQKAFLDQDSVPADIVSIPYHQEAHNFSQELQLRSPTGNRLTWILGAYYLHSVGDYDPLGVSGAAIAPLPPTAIAQTFATQTVNSYAGFAQATYKIFHNTNLTAGVRYTRDDYTIDGAQRIDFADGTNSGLVAQGHQSNHFPKVTYHFSVDQKLAKDVLLYASYSRGFKSGGYNILAYTTPPVTPEVLDAYEAGIKSEWFNRRLRVNLSGYYYNYTNLQVQFIGTGASYAVNAGGAHIKGLDAEITAMPVRHLTLSGAFSYIDGHYSSFPDSFTYIPNPAAIGGNMQVLHQDLTGNTTVRSPKFTGNISVDYTIPTEMGEFSATVSIYHNSGFFWEPDNRLRQPSYDLLNGTIGWKSTSGRLTAKLWVKNLLNDYYYSFATGSTFGDQRSPAQPRTYGVTLGAHF